MTLPPIIGQVEDALWRAAREILPADALREATLCQGIAERSARYTTHRDMLAAPLSGSQQHRDLAARAVFFTPADAQKLWTPLGELAGRGLFPATPELKVLDLGAGAGAMSLGLAGFLAHRELAARAEILAIDRDRDALAILKRAARHLPPPLAAKVHVQTQPGALNAGQLSGPADLVLLGSVLNELAPQAALELARAAVDALCPGGAVIIIEPALRDVARRLHELRDAMIASGRSHVVAPCTRRDGPCPALADARDWCHEDRPADLPPRCARLAQRTGLRTGGLKFAYLVLRQQPAALVEADPGHVALRVVSQPRRKKGSFEMFACGAIGRVRLRRLSRHRGGENRALDRARRGDVVVIPDTALRHSKHAKNSPLIDLQHGETVTRITPAKRDCE